MEVASQRSFPGQYYDAETGRNYNYFRDYDPKIGRYIESDPIGLEGGMNTYSYVAENPLITSDSHGLYIGYWHWQFTYLGGIYAGLTAQQANALADAVEDVDNGTQSPVDAYMHAMCGPGLDQATCENMVYEYINHQIDTCTPAGLANAIHAMQDSFASGHSNFNPYHGLFSLFFEHPVGGFEHLIGDVFPSSDERNIIPQDTRTMIKAFQHKCGCNKESQI